MSQFLMPQLLGNFDRKKYLMRRIIRKRVESIFACGFEKYVLRGLILDQIIIRINSAYASL